LIIEGCASISSTAFFGAQGPSLFLVLQLAESGSGAVQHGFPAQDGNPAFQARPVDCQTSCNREKS